MTAPRMMRGIPTRWRPNGTPGKGGSNCTMPRPAATSARAVRLQARNVRSFARVNRGSGSVSDRPVSDSSVPARPEPGDGSPLLCLSWGDSCPSPALVIAADLVYLGRSYQDSPAGSNASASVGRQEPVAFGLTGGASSIGNAARSLRLTYSGKASHVKLHSDDRGSGWRGRQR